MTLICPGVCRHCGCTENNACKLEDGDTCCWINAERTVCSSPRCQVAETQRVRNYRKRNYAEQQKREGERRQKRDQRYRRSKGRAA